jgi:fermentation-respiration switch protein FrsA (DUF1100 family)
LLSVALVGAVVMLYAGYMILWLLGMTSSARRSIGEVRPADLGLDYQDVTFTSDDGVTLAGWYIPSQNEAAVILLHGYGAHRVEMLKRAEILVSHGYGALLYDERASGESEGEMRSYGWADVQDVASALTVLQAREDVDPARIGILGFSQGGQIALRAAAQMPQLKAVVAEEPGLAAADDIFPAASLKDRWVTFNYWLGFKLLAWRTGLQAPAGVVEGMADIAPRPVLLIATAPPDDPGYRLVRHYYEHAGEPSAFWSVPEASHGQVPAIRPEEYEIRIVTFFDEALSTENRSN